MKFYVLNDGSVVATAHVGTRTLRVVGVPNPYTITWTKKNNRLIKVAAKPWESAEHLGKILVWIAHGSKSC